MLYDLPPPLQTPMSLLQVFFSMQQWMRHLLLKLPAVCAVWGADVPIHCCFKKSSHSKAIGLVDGRNNCRGSNQQHTHCVPLYCHRVLLPPPKRSAIQDVHRLCSIKVHETILLFDISAVGCLVAFIYHHSCSAWQSRSVTLEQHVTATVVWLKDTSLLVHSVSVL